MNKLNTTYNKSLFNIDNEAATEGYTNGTTWNGWYCPVFTKGNANKIIAYCRLNEMKAYYDETKDTYYIEIAETLESYKGHDIECNNETIHVYDIGCYDWCWCKVD